MIMKNHDTLRCFHPFTGCLNIPTYYYSLFGEFAHQLNDRTTYSLDVFDAIKKHYEKNPGYHFFSEITIKEKKLKPFTSDYTAIIKAGVILHCEIDEDDDDDDETSCNLHLYYRGDKATLDEFLKIVKPFRKNPIKKNRLFMITQDKSGLDLTDFSVRKMKVDVCKHYNDDFYAVHSEIKTFLKSDHSGLIILHGKQGTGKTSYIRHLIHSTNRKVIYITGDMAEVIASPSFIPFLIEQKGSVFVLEDCEELLAARGGSGIVNTGLINILNMSDGLLGDAMQFKFICTFNAPLKDIDKALLRKGRLIARYEFHDLKPEKANILISEQNLDIPKQTKSISLADLYHYKKPSFEQERRAIGF